MAYEGYKFGQGWFSFEAAYFAVILIFLPIFWPL